MKKNRYKVTWDDGRRIHSVVRIADDAVSAIDRVLDQYCHYDTRTHVSMVDADTRGEEYAEADYLAGDYGSDRRIVIRASRQESDPV